jgi:DNA-binding winged helix-turn-helix (wHTH) protein
VSEKKQGIYEFHDFQLDIGKGILLRDGESVSMQWKTFELLCVLIESNGNLLTRDDLMNELWADTFVEDNNLSQHIRLLRKALGDGESDATFIETVPRRGYRFLPEVRIVESVNEIETVFTAVERNQPETAKDILDESDFEPLTAVQPTTVSHASGQRNEAKIIAFPAPENSIETISGSEAVGENSPQIQSAIEQEAVNQPKVTKRRRGFRRGLKCLLWGVGIGFCFLIFLQILIIANTILVATPINLSNEVLKVCMTLLSMLSIPIFSGWFFGIGLFLFGIARIILALFEKENSKLNSSLFEKVFAIIITVLIAAVVIPNLIASYRSAQEFQQSEKNNSKQN